MLQDNLFFSIAGKKQHAKIDAMLTNMLECEFIEDPHIKGIIRHSLECSAQGAYPDRHYYEVIHQMQYDPDQLFDSVAEILVYSKKIIDFYTRSYLQRQYTAALNDTNTAKDLVSRYSEVLAKVDTSSGDGFDMASCRLRLINKSDDNHRHGILTGIREFDDLTGGITPGCICTVSAFTGEGKSTCTNSIVYRNAKEGKKCLIISLEVAKDIVGPMFQGRYLIQEHNANCSVASIVKGQYSDQVKDIAIEWQQDFEDTIQKNIRVCDESDLLDDRRTLFDPVRLQAFFKKFEMDMGGLDLIVIDHVGQFEEMFKDKGNNILKTVQTAVKTYIPEHGDKPVCIWCCQANREGWKEASKHGGLYKKNAIGDLHEVERSSSYIIFLYTPADAALRNETTVTIAKTRFDGVLAEPFTVPFIAGEMMVGDRMQDISVDEHYLDGFDSSAFDF